MKIYGIFIAIFIFGIGVIIWQNDMIGKLRTDRDTYKGNTETLLDSVKTYKTKDSLNAATVGALSLKINEFERFRAADMELIKTLDIKQRELQNIVTTQTRTISQLNGVFRDSVRTIVLPGQNLVTRDTLRCIDISEKWFDLHGCSDKDGNFIGTHEARDSLLVAVTVKYKRFWGFLWKTNKIKDKKVDIISRNPGTKILGVEYIEIRK